MREDQPSRFRRSPCLTVCSVRWTKQIQLQPSSKTPTQTKLSKLRGIYKARTWSPPQEISMRNVLTQGRKKIITFIFQTRVPRHREGSCLLMKVPLLNGEPVSELTTTPLQLPENEFAQHLGGNGGFILGHPCRTAPNWYRITHVAGTNTNAWDPCNARAPVGRGGAPALETTALGVPVVAQQLENLTCIYEHAGLISGLTQ